MLQGRTYRVGILFALLLGCYAAFNAQIPVTDPVESNYALTAKEMFSSGDWLSPRIYGQYWYDKPIMIYWLILACYKVFGVTEFAARFPAALFSTFSVLAIYWYAQRLFDRRTACFSALILASSLEYWLLAHLIITDSVLFFFSTMVMMLFFLGFKEKKPRYYTWAYGFAALAVLTKGPVGIVLPGLTFLIFLLCLRRGKECGTLFPLTGIILFFLIAAPWYLYMIWQHGQDFVNVFLGVHNYLRATVSEHPEDNVFYYYLVLFPVSILPWTGAFFAGLCRSDLFRFDRTTGIYHYLWLGVILLFYTAMATKYPTYVFPGLAPAAIITGYYLAHIPEHSRFRSRAGLLASTLFLLAVFYALPHSLKLSSAALSVNIALLLSLLAVVVACRYGDRAKWVGTVFVTVLFASIVLLNKVAIPFGHIRSARDIALTIPPGAVAACYGTYRTSAVFYSGNVLYRLENQKETPSASLSWSEKYTMPTLTEAEFAVRPVPNYVLMSLNDQNHFLQTTLGRSYAPVMSAGTLILYGKGSAPQGAEP